MNHQLPETLEPRVTFAVALHELLPLWVGLVTLLSRPLRPESIYWSGGQAARVRVIAALLADATEAALQTLREASEVIAARFTRGGS